MQSNRLNSRDRWDKKAFTLVEMLVVIAIISILMTIGVIGLNGVGGKGVISGVATAEGLFEEARSIAIGRNLRTCVLVAKDLTNNHSEDLRRILVAHEDVDANGQPKVAANVAPDWVLTGRGATLVEQTYFIAKYSKKDHTADTGALDEVTDAKLKAAPTTGKAVSSAYQGSYFIYEFNVQGVPTYINQTNTSGPSFILGTGTRNGGLSSTAQPPRVIGSAKRDFGGFIIWRSGRSSVFRSPDQMGGVKNLNSGDQF